VVTPFASVVAIEFGNEPDGAKQDANTRAKATEVYLDRLMTSQILVGLSLKAPKFESLRYAQEPIDCKGPIEPVSLPSRTRQLIAQKLSLPI
jgi:hypothetical protein